MRKLFVWLITLLLFLFIVYPASAGSSVSLYHKDRPLYLEPEDVTAEVSRLEKAVPELKDIDWEWRIWDGVKWYGDFILGETLPVERVVYLYSPPWSYLGAKPDIKSYVYGEVAHEMGHVARVEFISDEELAEYYAMRTEGIKVAADYYFNSPEEMFSEDFKSIWGRQGLWRKSWIPKPTEKDKQWILNHIRQGHERKQVEREEMPGAEL
jgi:hypothetical protein